MDADRFDHLLRSLTGTLSRRRIALVPTGLVVIAGLGPLLSLGDAEAKKKKRKKKKRKQNDNGGGAGASKGLRQTCTPGQDTCSAGLQCGAPTTRHTCSSTVQGISAWCCVPPGGSCTECDCCGDYYCEFDDNNNPTCQSNPEG